MDPRSFKPALVHVFNTALVELWIESALKDRIAIGNHTLEAVNSLRQARYRDSINHRFDGIHFYGPSGGKAYTISILNNLINAGILKTRVAASSLFSNFCRRKPSPLARRIAATTAEFGRSCDVRDTAVAPKRQNLESQYNVPVQNKFSPLNY